LSDYVELHARSAFSFLRGACAPEHLAETAADLEMPAMALCDRDGVYGTPRFFARAREVGVRAIVGAELTMEDQTILPVLVESRRGYQNLCQLLTRAHLRNEKGKPAVLWDELPEFVEGLVALTGDGEGPLVSAIESVGRKSALTPTLSQREREKHLTVSLKADAHRLASQLPNGHPLPWGEGRGERERVIHILHKLLQIFGPQNLFIEIQRHQLRGEQSRAQKLIALAKRFHLPLLATNGVLYATASQRPILDVFTCIRNHTHLDAAGTLLARNSERHLKGTPQMRELFESCPEAINNTVRLAERLQFSLENLGYEFPAFPVPPEHTMDSFLRLQAFAGAGNRYHGKIPDKVRQQLETELALIQKLKVAGYFLIVWDMIEFCRRNNIMAQGRGSAANSTVCFCLGITAVDPIRFNTLFERFLTEGRKSSWPDIDIDLPSGDRRERVLQEIYQRYGKQGAAMTANVITYRGRSAAREVGKALNISGDVLNRFSNLYANGDFPNTLELQPHMEKAGLPLTHPRAHAFASLYCAMQGLPRHLGQHSGGMIICQDKLSSVVPLENASMPNRVVAQWDKDDCEDLGIIKVDFLGLGMMSVLQDSVELAGKRGRPVDLAHLPENDPKTFAMMQQADTIGVFQIESRAQMSTLPRMKPVCFYDVVIEVAIIRPGPIQGGLMHPYLERRAGRQPVTYPHSDLKPVLERTLGVPLFQEQMLQIAMVLANFTGAEAEELRRALSFHRSEERMQRVEKKLRAAMERKGHPPELIEQIAAAISSFALYGFPESHAISFAHLAYASAYLKAHRAPEFYAGLLNNQPMGFYSSATLIKDGQRHGVKFQPVCVERSEWNCEVEPDDAIRLGFRVVRGMSTQSAERLLAERRKARFTSVDEFKRRARLAKDELRALAGIGALNCFGGHRRDALWEVEKEIYSDDLFEHKPPGSAGVSPLQPMTYPERVRADYDGMELTTGSHPMGLVRSRLKGIWRAVDLPKAKHGSRVRIAGNVICRQRPGTAQGVVFISLEDETGVSNAIVTPPTFEELRLVITQESFLIIEGKLQNVEGVIHIKAERIERLEQTALVAAPSHDFR
jgi:error-prone DNA polymerase